MIPLPTGPSKIEGFILDTVINFIDNHLMSGKTWIDVRGDGSCYFRALLITLGLPHTNHNVIVLRKIFAGILQHCATVNWDDYKLLTGATKYKHYENKAKQLLESVGLIPDDEAIYHPYLEQRLWYGVYPQSFHILMMHWSSYVSNFDNYIEYIDKYINT